MRERMSEYAFGCVCLFLSLTIRSNRNGCVHTAYASNLLRLAYMQWKIYYRKCRTIGGFGACHFCVLHLKIAKKSDKLTKKKKANQTNKHILAKILSILFANLGVYACIAELYFFFTSRQRDVIGYETNHKPKQIPTKCPILKLQMTNQTNKNCEKLNARTSGFQSNIWYGDSTILFIILVIKICLKQNTQAHWLHKKNCDDRWWYIRNGFYLPLKSKFCVRFHYDDGVKEFQKKKRVQNSSAIPNFVVVTNEKQWAIRAKFNWY